MSETKKLIQYGLYNREQVCSILAPDISFTPRSGTCGLQGLIRITPGQSNFVLFITLGATQAGYQFNETINNVGEFEWHSQPSLKLEDAIVEELVNHDIYKNNIFVFFRPKASKKEYIFLGHAKYISHSENKEMPVHIIWKVIDWNNQQFLNSLKEFEIAKSDHTVKPQKYECVETEESQITETFYKCIKSIRSFFILLKNEPQKIAYLRNLCETSCPEISMIVEGLTVDCEWMLLAEEKEKPFFDGINLSVRAFNILRDNGVKTKFDLILLEQKTISNFKNSGAKTNTEIVNAINFLLENNLIVRAEYLATFIDKIHSDYYELKVDDVFTLTISEQLKSQNIFLIKDLLNAGIEKLMKLQYKLQSFVNQLKILEKSLNEFIINELQDLLKNKSKTGKVDRSFERNSRILINRASEKTLEECGAEFGLTRERVRQLERKFLFRTKNFANSNAVKLFLKSKFYSQSYLFREDFSNILNEFSNLLLFTIVDNEVEYFHIIDEYDMFIVGDNWYEDINALFNSFPETIKTDHINQYKETIFLKFYELKIQVSDKVIEKLLEIEYTNNGFLFVKRNFIGTKKVVTVLQTYFRHGINIYDEGDLKKFRLLYAKMFDSDDLSLNDRALTSRIINKCILIGRGIYAPKKERYISGELANRIDAFIQSQDRGIISFNHILLTFEDELSEHGINNRYYLQGIVKEVFKGKYYTRRDYLTKSKQEFSYYEEIISFISKSKIPVSKEDIIAEFPGISDIVIAFATSNNEILNLFGSFIHISQLDIYDEEIQILKDAIDNSVKDGLPHSAAEILDITAFSLKHMYLRTGLNSKSKVYSLMLALFRERYQFKRPFVAKIGVEIVSGKEMLQEYVYSFDELDIEDIQDYAKENKILIYSIVDLIDSYNDTYLFKDSKSIIAIEKLKIDQDCILTIKQIIEDELADNEYLILNQIQSAHTLPKINISWNEWILYSIVKKYIPNVSAYTSDSQFRYATPVVCKENISVDKTRAEVGKLATRGNEHGFGELDVEKEFLESFDMDELEQEGK